MSRLHLTTHLERVGVAFIETVAGQDDQMVQRVSDRILTLKHFQRCECFECQLIDITVATLRAPPKLRLWPE